MILLFLAVWAIVIALNEVLFSAQPFALTNVADAMPSTLVLSVFLSAAVYLAKTKIIDALHKGRSIDKRFVAELTPQVGHELNNVRRQMEGGDPKKGTYSKPKAGTVRRATAATRGKVNPYTAAVQAARTPHNKARREAYQRAYGERTRHNLDAPELKKAQEGLEALDALGALNEDFGADVPMRTQTRRTSTSKKSSSELATTYGKGTKATATKSTKASSARSSSAASASSDSSKAGVKGTKRSATPSVAERKAQLEQSKEQQKQRRREQIEALSTLSQEDKVKAEAQQKSAEAQKKQRQKERQEQEAKAKAQAHQEFNQLKESLNPFAKKDAVRSKLDEKAKSSEMDGEGSGLGASSAAGDEAKILHSKSKGSSSQKTIRNTRTPQGERSEESSTFRGASASERAALQQNLERLQEEAKRTISDSSFAGGDDKHNVPDYVDSLEIPGKNVSQLDVSSLQRTRRPKQGAGLDTSALKKVTLSPAANANMQRMASPFKPQQVSGLSSDASGSGAGGRMLKTSKFDHVGAGNSMLKRSGELGVSTPQEGSSGMSVRENAAAMNTALSNDATIERGKVKSLGLAEFQANARARALARAQAPKTGPGWAGPKKTKTTTRRAGAAAGGSSESAHGRVGTASTLGLNNARTGLPTQMIPSDEAPVRKVVSTSMKLQVGPHSDNLPKVRPSDVIADLQLSPKIKARASGNIKRNREKLLQRSPNFINAAATAAAMGTVGSTSNQHLNHQNASSDKQAQNQADAYNKMQQKPSQDTPTDEQA